MHYLDYPINSGHLPEYLVNLFLVPVFLGQRNPLTAEMSSKICDNNSFGIVIIGILAIYFAKSMFLYFMVK